MWEINLLPWELVKPFLICPKRNQNNPMEAKSTRKVIKGLPDCILKSEMVNRLNFVSFLHIYSHGVCKA
jgi:hypothetical protein